MTERIEGVYSAPIMDAGKKTISLRLVNKILMLVLLASSIYYITTINDLVVKSFVLQDLEVKVESLRDDYRAMKVRTVALKSSSDLSDRIGQLGMVAAGDVDYIKVGNGVLAAR